MDPSGPTILPDGVCYVVGLAERVCSLRFGGVLASHMSILSPHAINGDTEVFPEPLSGGFTLGGGQACW